VIVVAPVPPEGAEGRFQRKLISTRAPTPFDSFRRFEEDVAACPGNCAGDLARVPRTFPS